MRATKLHPHSPQDIPEKMKKQHATQPEEADFPLLVFFCLQMMVLENNNSLTHSELPSQDHPSQYHTTEFIPPPRTAARLLIPEKENGMACAPQKAKSGRVDNRSPVQQKDFG